MHKIIFSAQSSARENFFSKKYIRAETLVIQMLPRVVYTILPSKISNLRRKTSSVPKIFAALLQKRIIKPNRSHVYILHFLRALQGSLSYTKGILKGYDRKLSTIFSTQKLFSKKYTIAEFIIIQQLSYAIYAFLSQKSLISSTKALKR